MIWIDVAMKTAALASAIIATLRAGSRVAYLLEHDGIGIMEGPAIQNTNETYPLFELSEAFRHCVRLTIVPDQYENVETKRKPVNTVVEPYPLSPRPYLAAKEETKETEKTSEGDVSNGSDAIVQIDASSQSKLSFWRTVADTFGKIPSSVSYTGKYLAMTPQIASYWTSKLWNWKREAAEQSDLEEEGKEDIALNLSKLPS